MQESVKRDAFVFYRSFFECLENLAEEDKAAAYDMFYMGMHLTQV